jgi:outer membrane lipoprotein-sorting protein
MKGHGRRRFSILPAALLLLWTVGSARSDPARLLRAAAGADQRLSYTGIRIVQASDGDGDAERRVHVWHLAPDQTRTEYMSPDGGNILLECGAARWFYSAHRGSWRPVEWHASPPYLDLLFRNYRVRWQGSDMVAGRRVVRLAIEPRHPGNPDKRVWIDPTCQMVLREEVRDYGGHVVASSRFETFELIRELSASLFEPPAAPAVHSHSAELPYSALRPRYLPPGYQEVRQSGLRRGHGDGVFLLYTDGLGAISLFEFRRESGSAPWQHEGREKEARHEGREGGGPRGEKEGEGQRGRHRRPGASPDRFTRQVGDRVCRVMGDIAPEELHKMLDSLSDKP